MFPFTRIPYELKISILKSIDEEYTPNLLKLNKSLRGLVLSQGRFYQRIHKITLELCWYEDYEAFDDIGHEVTTTIITSIHLIITYEESQNSFELCPDADPLLPIKPFDYFRNIQSCKKLALIIDPYYTDWNSEKFQLYLQNILKDSAFLPNLRYIGRLKFDLPLESCLFIFQTSQAIVTNCCALTFDGEKPKSLEPLEKAILLSECKLIFTNHGGLMYEISLRFRPQVILAFLYGFQEFQKAMESYMMNGIPSRSEYPAAVLRTCYTDREDGDLGMRRERIVTRFLDSILASRVLEEIDQESEDARSISDYFRNEVEQEIRWDFILVPAQNSRSNVAFSFRLQSLVERFYRFRVSEQTKCILMVALEHYEDPEYNVYLFMKYLPIQST